MEEKEQTAPEMEETPEKAYKPRPTWQIWAARIGVAVMIICVALYYIQIARGGR